MPTPTNRESITTTLEARYNAQKAGGAFDAKAAGTSTEESPQAARYENTGKFVVGQRNSNFKNVEGSSYKEISLYSKNLSTVKYKG
jgi:hypothetical protein